MKEKNMGSLCTKTDLGEVGKPELIRFITHLNIQLEDKITQLMTKETELEAKEIALNTLTEAFTENISRLSIAHAEAIKTLNASVEKVQLCRERQ